jgi:CubicO group peptidase (beta-lactamase class C family)
MRILAALLVGGSIAASIAGCGTPRGAAEAPGAAPVTDFSPSFGESTLAAEGLDARPFAALTRRLRDDARAPIFSILVSRHGRLVYEAYTSSLGRDHAHYLMSVTKSVLSALVGAAVDRGLLPAPDQPLASVFPPRLFASEEDRARFRALTLAQVLGMSALDSPDPPRDMSPAAVLRHRRFNEAENRARFALTQPLLGEAGTAFQYNDVTPTLASAAISYATHRTALEFGQEVLFGPLGFRNVEWMHQDRSGLDVGGYGLRLRPIDMQKLGNLYLAGGVWNGQQLLSRAWVDRSFTPWNRSHRGGRVDYGWFWWQRDYGPGFVAGVASGWKGQRIAVFRDKALVVTMTACFEPRADEPGLDEKVFEEVVRRYVAPAVVADRDAPSDPVLNAELKGLLDELRRGPLRATASTEWRMIPSIEAKERHHGLDEGI